MPHPTHGEDSVSAHCAHCTKYREGTSRQGAASCTGHLKNVFVQKDRVFSLSKRRYPAQGLCFPIGSFSSKLVQQANGTYIPFPLASLRATSSAQGRSCIRSPLPQNASQRSLSGAFPSAAVWAGVLLPCLAAPSFPWPAHSVPL